jgi:hypothetical protein
MEVEKKVNFAEMYYIMVQKQMQTIKQKKLEGYFLVLVDRSTRHRMPIVVGRAGFEPA